MIDRSEKRKKQVLFAAFKAVSEQGFNNVTLQDISEYANVSKGVISYYFDNKEEVFCNLLEWITAKIHKNEFLAVNKSQTAIEKMQAYLNAVFVSPKENHDFYRVYLEFLAQANHNEKFRKINDQFYSNCWSITSEIIKLGQIEGTFAKVDIDKAAYMIRALIDGCLIQWLMRGNYNLHKFYRDNCFDTILRYLTNEVPQGNEYSTYN